MSWPVLIITKTSKTYGHTCGVGITQTVLHHDSQAQAETTVGVVNETACAEVAQMLQETHMCAIRLYEPGRYPNVKA